MTKRIYLGKHTYTGDTGSIRQLINGQVGNTNDQPEGLQGQLLDAANLWQMHAKRP